MKYCGLFTRLHCALKSKDIKFLCGKEATPYWVKLIDLHGNDTVAAFFKEFE